jgi:flagellar hook protein FlgE
VLRSLFSGISGLRTHQTMMDVVGNNIANVNTAGYKTSQSVFEDHLSQMIKSGGAPQAGNGGTNAAQVGLGVRLASITTNFGQGALQLTGRSTDMAINGDGFFVVQSGGEQLYTRSGAFSFDASGTLVTASGAAVQGWAADATGSINSNGAPTAVTLPMATVLPPTRTSSLTMEGNLPTGAPVGTVISTTIDAYDGQGALVPVAVTMTSTAANGWDMAASVNGTPLTVTGGSLAFDASTGALTGTPAPTFTLPGAAGGTVTLDVAALTQFGTDRTASATGQNGSPMGSLTAFTISPDGTLVGVFSNGLKQPLAQLSIASFNNPPGLEKVGASAFRSSVNSGVPPLGVAATGGRGTLSSGSLEMSNVDLAQEFTNLIVAQRGFQANSRVITSSDEILQDLVNLKR